MNLRTYEPSDLWAVTVLPVAKAVNVCQLGEKWELQSTVAMAYAAAILVTVIVIKGCSN